MRIIASLAVLLIIGFAGPVAAQTAKSAKPAAKETARDRAVKRCKENRGADCESAEGLREWMAQERPITKEEQAAAAGARRHREGCAKNKNGVNC